MDKLLKLSQEHGEVFESLAFFKKAMSVVNIENTPKHIEKFNNLFQDYVLAHFAYEENKIFPPVLKGGPFKAQRIVRELQSEHIRILATLDKFKDLVARAGKEPSAGQLKKITETAQSVIKMVLAHARKEDTAFFPLIKKLGIKL